jgi:plastocyanin
MSARLLFAPLAVALVVAPLAPVVVGQKGKKFSQSEVTVKVGEKLVFNNDDDVTHNVFSAAPGFAFNVVAMKPGANHEVAFTKTGSFDVRCAFHPAMKVKITVTK